jgi:hypothetical protein
MNSAPPSRLRSDAACTSAASGSASAATMTTPIAYFADFDGYQCLVFLHESGHFSVVFVRPTADAALKALRFEAAFEAACRAIPALSEWTEPARAHPTSEVLVGGALRNIYRRQTGTPGLVAVEADPRIGQHAAGYFAMTASPETLRPAEPWARAVYQRGWRPAYAPGPKRDDLVNVIRGAVPAA